MNSNQSTPASAVAALQQEIRTRTEVIRTLADLREQLDADRICGCLLYTSVPLENRKVDKYHTLVRLSDTKIKRHIKIRSEANPYDADWKDFLSLIHILPVTEPVDVDNHEQDTQCPHEIHCFCKTPKVVLSLIHILSDNLSC